MKELKLKWSLYTISVLHISTSVIRQKGESQNGGNKKAKHAKFSDKRTFLTPWYVCVSGDKKCSFCGKLGVLCFLVTSILRLALLPYYRRVVSGNDDDVSYVDFVVLNPVVPSINL